MTGGGTPETVAMRTGAEMSKLEDALRHAMRIDPIPYGPGWRWRDIDLYTRFLDEMDGDQRSDFLEDVRPLDLDLWVRLTESREGYLRRFGHLAGRRDIDK